MHRFMPKLSLATPLVAICLTVASSAAIAQNSRVDQAGHTSVALSAGFVAALGDLDVTPGTIYPTELEDGKVSFPITSGVLDLDTAKLQLLHSGGLTFKAGSTKVTLSSFIIDDTASARPLVAWSPSMERCWAACPSLISFCPATLSFHSSPLTAWSSSPASQSISTPPLPPL